MRILALCLILSTACGADPSGAIAEPLSVDAGPDAPDAAPDAPANCALDTGRYAPQPYTCAGGLWLCSSAPDAGAPPFASCARPGPVVVAAGVEWTTWCCQ
jgi:hypothetical protein